MVQGYQITPDTPQEIAATFDRVRVASLRYEERGPMTPADLQIMLRYFRDIDDAVREDSPAAPINMRIRDVWKEAAMNPAKLGSLKSMFDDPKLTADEALGLGMAAVQFAVEKYAKGEEVI